MAWNTPFVEVVLQTMNRNGGHQARRPFLMAIEGRPVLMGD
jgi:hypothetical protein